MKNRTVLFCIALLFITIITAYIIRLYHFAQICHPWIIGDWLINYSGGFVRRGLCGELMIWLSDVFNIKVHFIVMLSQITIYLAMFVVFFLIIFRKKMTIWFLLLLLSPATLLFSIYDNGAIGRKEIFLFLLFGLYILCLNKKKLKSYSFIFTFSFALMIITLFHEGIFFFTPYFIGVTYLKSRIDNEPLPLFKTIIVILGSFLAIIPLYLFGKEINGSEICISHVEKGLPPSICNGALFFPGDFGIKDLLNYATTFNYFPSYFIALILGVIPFVLLIKFYKHPAINVKRFLLIFLLLFLFSVPLFVVALDWGRWLNIHFTMLMFTSTIFLKDNAINSSNNKQNDNLQIPVLWFSNNKMLKTLNNLVFFTICFCYISFWSIKLCCSASLLSDNFNLSYLLPKLKNLWESLTHLFLTICDLVFYLIHLMICWIKGCPP